MAVSRRHLFAISSGLYSLVVGKGAFAREKKRSSKRDYFAEVSEVFAYGVASGDPLSDRVILWTHVADRGSAEVSVLWQASLDSNFDSVVSEGTVLALASTGFTIKVDARLPMPQTSYYYRFYAQGVWSTIGRTRTAPESSDQLRFAVVSCSSIWSGYFNAYERLSKRDDIDLIIHCGDYVYDVPDPDEQRNMPFRVVNTQSPSSLEAHRQRYRYYRSNEFLRAAHQQHPFAIIWDNHDIITPAPRSEAIQAFFEWQPVRNPSEQPDRLYRTLDYGSLVNVILLDTRHIGRGQTIGDTSDLTLLGDEQFEWLKGELRSSKAKWNVVVNQVLLSPFIALGKPLTTDAWQNFPADAFRFKNFLRDEGIHNTIVVSGDAHLSYACNLEAEGTPVGIEFLPTSVTRGNLDEVIAKFLSKLIKGLVEGAVRMFNPNIRYFETEAHGYGLLDLQSYQTTCEFWYVDHEERSQDEKCGRAIKTYDGANRITEEKASVTTSRRLLGAQAPAESRLYQKGLEVGGKGGGYFDGEERMHRNSRLNRLTLRTDKDGDAKALSFHYNDGAGWQLGGSDGSFSNLEMILEDGEYLREMTVGLHNKKGGVLVSYMSFKTSESRTIEAGKRPRQTIAFIAPEGRHIVSFHGRSGDSIDKLGPIFAPDF